MCPSTQAETARALVNYGDSAQADAVTPYLPAILPRLFHMIKEGGKSEKEYSLTAVGSLADTNIEAFEPFFDIFMPTLIWIVETITDDNMRMIRGRAMECLSILGASVEPARFAYVGAVFADLFSVTSPCCPCAARTLFV
jgi:importin-5